MCQRVEVDSTLVSQFSYHGQIPRFTTMTNICRIQPAIYDVKRGFEECMARLKENQTIIELVYFNFFQNVATFCNNNNYHCLFG